MPEIIYSKHFPNLATNRHVAVCQGVLGKEKTQVFGDLLGVQVLIPGDPKYYHGPLVGMVFTYSGFRQSFGQSAFCSAWYRHSPHTGFLPCG